MSYGSSRTAPLGPNQVGHVTAGPHSAGVDRVLPRHPPVRQNELRVRQLHRVGEVFREDSDVGHVSDDRSGKRPAQIHGPMNGFPQSGVRGAWCRHRLIPLDARPDLGTVLCTDNHLNGFGRHPTGIPPPDRVGPQLDGAGRQSVIRTNECRCRRALTGISP